MSCGTEVKLQTEHPMRSSAGCAIPEKMERNQEVNQNGGDAHVNNTPRDEHPSGWLVLAKHRSVAYMIDAILDLPEYREFNQKELANFAGVSRKSVNRHIDLLKTASIVTEVPNSSPTRFRFDTESPISNAIIQIDGEMNRIGANRDSSFSASD